MKKMMIFLIILMIFLTSCSHNPAVFTIGKKVSMGNAEYGEMSYLNGIAILDVSRENSSWSVEIDEEDGISMDTKTNTIKGIKKITRTIGKQVSGNLVELSEKNPEAVKDYLSK